MVVERRPQTFRLSRVILVVCLVGVITATVSFCALSIYTFLVIYSDMRAESSIMSAKEAESERFLLETLRKRENLDNVMSDADEQTKAVLEDLREEKLPGAPHLTCTDDTYGFFEYRITWGNRCFYCIVDCTHECRLSSFRTCSQ